MGTIPANDPPLEQPPPTATPCTAGDLFLLAFLLILFWPAVAQATLLSTGFYSWYYGSAMTALATEDAAKTNAQTTRDLVGLGLGPVAAEKCDPAQRKTFAQLRMSLWALALAFPFIALSAPLWLALWHRLAPNQWGLTARHLGRNLLLGVAGWAVLTPLVFAVHALTLFLLTRWPGGVETHPFSLLAQQGLSATEWILFVMAVSVLAPVREEILFRGLLQPWIARQPRQAGFGVMFLGLIFVLIYRWQAIQNAGYDVQALSVALLPVLFSLVLILVFLLLARRDLPPAPLANFATAALFATIHLPAWPAPIALFFLGLGLGWLADRSKSLVAPMVVHALFNGVSAAQVLLV